MILAAVTVALTASAIRSKARQQAALASFGEVCIAIDEWKYFPPRYEIYHINTLGIVSDERAAFLAELPYLRELGFVGGVTEIGFRAITKLDQIEELHMPDVLITKVDAEGWVDDVRETTGNDLQCLYHMTGLKKLHVIKGQFKPEDLSALRQALPRLQIEEYEQSAI
jgi:hypothetical protein